MARSAAAIEQKIERCSWQSGSIWQASIALDKL